MVVLATLVLIIIAVRAWRAPSPGLWVGYAITGALGLWTIPIMVYPLGGVTCWLLVLVWRDLGTKPRKLWRESMLRASLAAVGAGLLAVLLYAPIIDRSGVGVLTGNVFVEPSPFPRFVAL